MTSYEGVPIEEPGSVVFEAPSVPLGYLVLDTITLDSHQIFKISHAVKQMRGGVSEMSQKLDFAVEEPRISRPGTGATSSLVLAPVWLW